MINMMPMLAYRIIRPVLSDIAAHHCAILLYWIMYTVVRHITTGALYSVAKQSAHVEKLLAKNVDVRCTQFC